MKTNKYLRNRHLTLIGLVILSFIIVLTNTGCSKSNNNIPYPSSPIDGPYIFSFPPNHNVISVDINNVISIKETTDTIFSVQSALNPDITFNVTIMDQSEIEPSVYETSHNVLAVSDIEGNLPLFLEFLKSNLVINEHLKWIYGANHLVLNGDFFDRGPDVTALLWFIYKLESEAKLHSGRVHFILGNHEAMNLSGELTYVLNKYISLANALNMPYKKLYGENSVLGRWLRTKNAIEKIKGDLYCHGGISYRFAGKNISIDDANNLIRDNIGKNQSELCNDDQDVCFLYGMNGPLWYNGYFNPKGITVAQVEKILHQFNAQKIIVGHSIVNEVKIVLNNKVIGIDAINDKDPRNMNEYNLGNFCEGLLVEDEGYFKVDSNGNRKKLI